MEIYVNSIREESNAIHGITTQEELVIENFLNIYGDKKTNGLVQLAKSVEEFHVIDRAYQYVCLIQKNKLGLSMKFTDFKGVLDNALDEYLELDIKNWEKKDIEKYVKIAKEINDDTAGKKATLVRKGLQFD